MYLYGLHDEQGVGLVPDGGWCLDLIALNSAPPPKRYDTRVNWLVRLDWGYGGAGTIPKKEDEAKYLENLRVFVGGTTGVWGYIIGNEPNHQQEWPGGEEIRPQDYCRYYMNASDIIGIHARDGVKVSPAAIAPYQLSSIPYWKQMTQTIAMLQADVDFLSLHAYTRGSNPDDIHKDLKMNPPLAQYQSGFHTYKDFLAEVPAVFSALPSVITEFDEYGPWEDRNTGVVQAAYQDIALHNQQQKQNPVFGLLLYRYPNRDQWYIEGKNGVIADFKEACLNNIEAPTIPSMPPISTFLPSIEKEAQQMPLFSFERDLDERATKRGVKVQEIAQDLDGWRVTRTHWYDEQEADSVGGDHHIYFDTLDENGNRIAGVPILVKWPSGFTNIRSEEKKGERFSANFPMSPSRNDYTVRVADGSPSDTVEGIGMGQDTPSGFNPGIHTSTEVIFQRLKGIKGEQKPPKPPVVEGKIALQPPFNTLKSPPITAYFGPSEDYEGALKGHEGLDFAVASGTPVYATAPGVAQEVGEQEGLYGKYIKLVHPWGETLYAHLSEHLVQQGMAVHAEELIGKSGSTGNSTGPHLHFGLRVNPYNRGDGYLGFSDPLPYLPKAWLEGEAIPEGDNTSLVDTITDAAREFGVDEDLLLSLAWAESSFNSELEDGLFQIGDLTWSDYAVALGATDIKNPRDNARVAAAYLKFLLDHYQGDEWKALTAYNFGIGNLDSGEPVPQKTTTYVNKIIHGKDLLKAVLR